MKDIEYVISNLFITQKNLKEKYNDLLYLINKQAEFRKQAESNLTNEIQNFINKI